MLKVVSEAMAFPLVCGKVMIEETMLVLAGMSPMAIECEISTFF